MGQIQYNTMATIVEGSLLSGIRGTVAGITVDKNGIVRQKNKKTTSQAPRSLENQKEFSTAGKATKIFRAAFPNLIAKASDRLFTSRMTQKMKEAINMDTSSIRGERNVLDGELSVLLDFEFNRNSIFSSVFIGTVSATLTRATGAVSIQIEAFDPILSVFAPEGTTHFQFIAESASIDFDTEQKLSQKVLSSIKALQAGSVAEENLSISLDANVSQPVIVAIGIEFFQEINGIKYPLENMTFNAAKVILVDVLV